MKTNHSNAAKAKPNWVAKVILTLWLLIVGTTISAQQVVTTANVNLRSGPSTTSSIVSQIPQGTTLDLDNCRSSWCSVSVSGQTGYIARQYTTSVANYGTQDEISSGQAHPTEPVKYYQNSKGNTVQSPTHYDAVPEGATAECQDGTFSFSQNRRGTCSHHGGGVKRWLK